MKDKKQIIKLQKSSGLFMQLGLVLTLAIVYALFEHQTEINNPVALTNESEFQEDKTYVAEYQIERKQIEVAEQIPEERSTDLSDFEKAENDLEKIETEILLPDPEKQSSDFDTSQLEDISIEDPLEKEDFGLNFVEEVPIYPGCEKGTKAQKKACFEKKVGKFINRKFNIELASQLGLPSGKQKIHVQFKITKTGDIEIIGARAGHKRLEKEGKRVVNMLPQMTPGKQNGKEVNVSYTIPISFNVQ